MSVVVVATITPKPDQVDAVREAILAAVPKVHAEPGCELYALHEGNGEFVMVERWESAGGAEGARHGRGADDARAVSWPASSTAAPDVRRLTAVPAGDPVKGAV